MGLHVCFASSRIISSSCACLAVALLLASAANSSGFPVYNWGNNPKYNPKGSAVEWVVPNEVLQQFEDCAIALVFAGNGSAPNDIAVVWDESGNAAFHAPGASRPPVLMDVAVANDTYFSSGYTYVDTAGISHAASGRAEAGVEFCLFPENGNGGQGPVMYVDLLPSGKKGDGNAIWDYFPAPRYHPVANPNPNNKNPDVEYNIGNTPTGSFATPVSFWFTVFVFDSDTVNGSEGYVEYNMEFHFTATASGNSLLQGSIDFDFTGEFKNIENIPEPATALLALAGVGVLIAHSRGRWQSSRTAIVLRGGRFVGCAGGLPSAPTF